MYQSRSEHLLSVHKSKSSIGNAKYLLKTRKILPALRYVVEPVETIGNHCLAVLKLFELTRDREVVKLGMEFLAKSAVRNGNAHCWRFSSSVTDIPPDADDTAIALLVFHLAKKLNIRPPAKFLRKECIEQFDSLISERGGIYTYFGRKEGNDVDPVVNTIAAFLLEFSGINTKARTSIKKYLNEFIEGKEKFHSEYYVHKEYFLLRCAKLNAVFPQYLSDGAKEGLKRQVTSCKPKTKMQKAFIRSAKIFLEMPKKCAGVKIPQEKIIFPEPLYIQRTPFYEYGSQLENQLFEAEAKELQKKASKHYTLALSKA